MTAEPAELARRARSCWIRGVLAAGISMAAAGMIATPLNSSADTLAAGGQPMSSAASLLPAMDARGVPFGGTPAVGALFATSDGALRSHFCSASVVDSPARDLLVTAAHCVTGPGSGSIVFVPGYDEGRIPYGVWRITRVIVGQGWTSSAEYTPSVSYADRFGALVVDLYQTATAP
jgi:hypothetical protein